MSSASGSLRKQRNTPIAPCRDHAPRVFPLVERRNAIADWRALDDPALSSGRKEWLNLPHSEPQTRGTVEDPHVDWKSKEHTSSTPKEHQ